MKIFAGGPQDLMDARGVLKVSGDKIDFALLKRLTRRYGVQELKVLEGLINERP